MTCSSTIDLIFGGRLAVAARLPFIRGFARASAESLIASPIPAAMAIIVPAWDESAVIGAMLRNADPAARLPALPGICRRLSQ